ncbi:urease accessory protein UreF [Litoreibacter roseus]|uniref:Urease accessory protein UreF n=1 Tax=Litoreibacter roseus TaxID=2601869 RepID=A0A6N6JDW1_9RHOB|nr:urease accessory UreF family protein [Litoreibacter roseus]GFE64020.1 urease accessory protein UreF [Litoreibacter roseus]
MSTIDRLSLVQWLSPAFPVGGYAYSHGLEQSIARGDVSDADSFACWLRSILTHGAGRSDAILLCCALRGDNVADEARAFCPSSERWVETIDQGRAFLAVTNSLYGEARAPAALPVAVGLVAQCLSLSGAEVAAIYLHSFASNLVSAAVRFVPLGQTAGQAVLNTLHPMLVTLAEEAEHATVDQIGTSVFGADLAAMEHEVMDVRVFRT